MTCCVGILVPSLNRPQNLTKLVANLHDTAGYPHRLHFCVSDQESQEILSTLGEHFIVDSGEHPESTFANRVNRLYRETDEDVFYFCGDDDSHYDGWLATMMDCFRPGIEMVVAKCLHVTLQTRKYVEEQSCCVDVPNVVIYPGYIHNYAEWELTCTAHMRGVMTVCPVETVEHHRWASDGKDCIEANPYDDTYKRGDDGFVQDTATFTERENRLFPGHRHWTL